MKVNLQFQLTFLGSCNISKEKMDSLRSLSQDASIVIENADKSNMIVIMNKTDY